MKTFKIYTLGCKVNQYETQCIREKFLRSGFKEMDNRRKSDIYIINTCTVTHKADADSRRFISMACRQNPCAKVVVTGCYTELDGDEIAKIKGVTYIIKNKDKFRIPELLNENNEHNEIGIPNAVNTSSYIPGSRRDTEAVTTFGISSFLGHTRAFLKIQDGCDNLCSYCKVPLVRGKSKSRFLNEIIQEAERLVKNGFKEIVLSGICLGSYGRDLSPKVNLVDVIDALENMEGLLRIRLSSIEATDICDELIERIAQSKKACHHLHIPLQSGDADILKEMNRRVSPKDFLNLINRIKERLPQIAITTDVMVGFPGESEDNFENTVKLIQEIIPLRVHIFPYSPRESTAASDFKNRVNPLVIKKRILKLKNITQQSSLTFRAQFLNKQKEVLVEDKSKKKPHFWQGYTDNYIKVLIKSNHNYLKNELIPVILKEVKEDFMLAEFN